MRHRWPPGTLRLRWWLGPLTLLAWHLLPAAQGPESLAAATGPPCCLVSGVEAVQARRQAPSLAGTACQAAEQMLSPVGFAAELAAPADEGAER